MEIDKQCIQPVEDSQVEEEISDSPETLEVELEVKNESVLEPVESAAKSGCGRCG